MRTLTYPATYQTSEDQPPPQSPPPTADELIHQFLPDARRIASAAARKAAGTVELSEMVSLANFGLTKAATSWAEYCESRGFDPRRIEYFKTYASRRIQGAILDAQRSADWATRAHRTTFKLMVANGYSEGTSLEDLSDRIGVPVADMMAAIKGVSVRPVSLEADNLDFASDHSTEDSVVDNTAVQNLLSAAIQVIEDLPEFDQIILALRYYRGMDIRTIADELCEPETRIHNVHSAAVLRIHQALLEEANSV